ncbi:hypothetical protein [Burkholderia sp. D-99]|uniref:hypothetical protein n=1 Tax=Burkholderia sp. D-99 TaxID=2717316 RepID=UPI001421F444|nr:hypothetical protein [Burkholderia sp. D-99]NHV29302.1 hypothetical protein [Burkholderia sp. D-99]
MYQYDDPTAVSVMPVPAAAGTAGFFTDGNPATAVPSTVLRADFMNTLMMEVLNVLSAAGIAPDKTKQDQLQKAISALLQQATRTRLTQNTNFYVNASTGSDSNNGLTSGAAWATITKALTVLQQNYDLAGYTATINVAAGSYAPGIAIGAFFGALASNSVQVVATGLATVTNPSGGSAACFYATAGAQFAISGPFTLVNNSNGSSCAQASGWGSILNIGSGLTLGFSAGSHFLANAEGVLNINANYSIANNGGAGSHYNVANGGSLNVAGGITVTIGTSIGITNAFAFANGLSQINAVGITFSGTSNVTGSRYTSQTNSVINTNSGGTNYFPGSTAGSSSTGGQYV